jgi:hypothetical protein
MGSFQLGRGKSLAEDLLPIAIHANEAGSRCYLGDCLHLLLLHRTHHQFLGPLQFKEPLNATPRFSLEMPAFKEIS